MTRARLASACIGVLVFLTLVSGTAWAQSGTSGIAGVVRDTSGAVLPGVTVEAASPALIEKVRTVVTDGEGSFRILDLRPGAYTVTFTLTGFASVRREGIDLPAAFTATVNADMRVGAVEETVTVSGAAPTVDVQNVTSQRLLQAELLESVPAARSPQGFTALTPGITSAGLGGIPGGREEMNMGSHGAPDGESVFAIDGMNTAEVQNAGGASTVFRISQSMVQEINVIVGGGSAEQPWGGTVINVIPKEGGNSFTGGTYIEYSGEDLAATNLTEKLQAQGLTSTTGLVRLWDVNPYMGGRLLRDKLWFFGSYRNSGTAQSRAGMYQNLTPLGWAYTPDLSTPALNRIQDRSTNLRVTWQATERNKFSFFGDVQPHIVFHRSYQFLTAPEATTYTPYLPNSIATIGWKSPVTSRVLLDATIMFDKVDFNLRRTSPEWCDCNAPAVGFDVISGAELSTGTMFRSASDLVTGNANYGHFANKSFRYAANMSYITGSHALKVGVQALHGSEWFNQEPNGAVGYSMRNGLPTSVRQYATPLEWENAVRPELGFFVQDQWTRGRMTITAGGRYDQLVLGYTAQNLPGGLWVGERSYPDTKGLNWKDFSPRIAGSFDLFGDGRTALKASLGRFVMAHGATAGGINNNNPVPRSVLFVNRSWGDTNGNFNPDCDLKNPLANGECGQISDLNFGQNNPNATTYDPELLTENRNYNWETTVVLQRQLAPGASVAVGYYRRQFGNFQATDNQFVTSADYNQYCITSPVDSRLPDGGGKQVCGLYDIVPALFGRTRNVVRLASHFGEQSQVYDGFDITENLRLPGGATISGGVNWGRTKTSACFVVDSPEALRFCEINPPMLFNNSFVGFVPLPWWGLMTSATYRNYPGPQITASRTTPNSEIVPSLGRNLAAGVNGTVAINLIQPGTMYSSRQQQLDFRISKRIRFNGNQRVAVNFDFFNILNWSGVNTLNVVYGPAWPRPTLVQGARFLKLSGTYDF
jgi:hypothetical protein